MKWKYIDAKKFQHISNIDRVYTLLVAVGPEPFDPRKNMKCPQQFPTNFSTITKK
jgi:hypothetical protein